MFRWENLLTPHLDEVDKLVVNVGSLRQEETVARTELMEEVQPLISAKLAMVLLGSFFLQADRAGMSTGKNRTSSLPAPLNLGIASHGHLKSLTPCTDEHQPIYVQLPAHQHTCAHPPICYMYMFAQHTHPPTHLAATPASSTTPRFRAAPPT